MLIFIMCSAVNCIMNIVFIRTNMVITVWNILCIIDLCIIDPRYLLMEINPQNKNTYVKLTKPRTQKVCINTKLIEEILIKSAICRIETMELQFQKSVRTSINVLVAYQTKLSLLYIVIQVVQIRFLLLSKIIHM